MEEIDAALTEFGFPVGPLELLDEGIVRSPRDAEVGAVFGLGFPPFLGGPLRWIDRQGATRIVADMQRLAARFGPRFTPARLLTEMAHRGDSFHPPNRGSGHTSVDDGTR